LESTAFVLGNGTSRKTINLNELKRKGITFGCNALYREFSPDYLIAVDTKMILEISQAGYQHQQQVWTNRNKNFKKIKGLNFFQSDKGWSSGPTALHFASTTDVEDIYILGFDFIGIENKINNIYAGTYNYKRIDEHATFHGNWLRQTLITCQKFSKKRYIRVLGENGYIPQEFHDLSNMSHINIKDFKDIFKLS
jgi:hypothetical protein